MTKRFKLKNANSDKYGYSSYGIGFDARSQFSLPGGSQGKNVITFGVYNSSPVQGDNKKEDILVLGESPAQGIDDTIVTAEAKYSINFTFFTFFQKKIVLSLNYNARKS